MPTGRLSPLIRGWQVRRVAQAGGGGGGGRQPVLITRGQHELLTYCSNRPAPKCHSQYSRSTQLNSQLNSGMLLHCSQLGHLDSSSTQGWYSDLQVKCPDHANHRKWSTRLL